MCSGAKSLVKIPRLRQSSSQEHGTIIDRRAARKRGRGSPGYNAAMSRGLSRLKLAAIPLRRGEAAQTTMSTPLRAG
jgi:hypothetical protein